MAPTPTTSDSDAGIVVAGRPRVQHLPHLDLGAGRHLLDQAGPVRTSGPGSEPVSGRRPEAEAAAETTLPSPPGRPRVPSHLALGPGWSSRR